MVSWLYITYSPINNSLINSLILLYLRDSSQQCHRTCWGWNNFSFSQTALLIINIPEDYYDSTHHYCTSLLSIFITVYIMSCQKYVFFILLLIVDTLNKHAFYDFYITLLIYFPIVNLWYRYYFNSYYFSIV